MFDLVYTDANHVDKGVIQAYSLDAAWGVDENDFQLVMPAPSGTVPEIPFGAFVYIDGTQLGGIVDDKSPDGTDDVATVTYHGRTWHGVMAYSVIQPDAGKDYYTYSGDANDTIRAIIDRQGLGDVFACVGNSGINVNGRFDRYVDMYSGFTKMLTRDASRRGRLSIWKEPGGKVHVEAVEASSYTDEVDSDRYGFKSTLDARPINHLICLGEGDLKERDVVHLYADKHGNVSTTQTLFGVDERALKYDYSNADHDELVANGIEYLSDLQNTSTISMTVADGEGKFEVGDIVGALDNLSGINVEAYVSKVIVRVDDNGIATYSYEVGDISSSSSEASGGGVSMSTLQAGYVKNSGDTMTGDLELSRSNPHVVIKNTDWDNTAISQASNQYANLGFKDKNDLYLGYLETSKRTDGSSLVSLASRGKASGSEVTNYLNLYVNADGSRKVTMADSAPWHVALNTKGQGGILMLYGSGSAAADALTLSQSWQNILKGKCSSHIYNGNDGVSIGSVSTADGVITVREAGNYLITYKVQFYNGFTANDLAQMTISVNGSAQTEPLVQTRVTQATPYEIKTCSILRQLTANSTVELVVKNNTGARGTAQRTANTNIAVVKL